MSVSSSSVKLLKCTKCSFTTYYNQSLKIHMYRKHELTLEEAKPFVCKLCGYRTNYRGNLQKHIRVHTGERPYRCNVCEKGFTTSSNLKMHMLRHHGQGPKPLPAAAAWPATPAAANTMFTNQLFASNPELMRQYYATLVGQAFAQQGALIPMMQQAAMMHHGLTQEMRASANQASSSGVGSMSTDDKEPDKKPVVGLDVPAAFGSQHTPEREPDSCGMSNEMNLDTEKTQEDGEDNYDMHSKASSSPSIFDHAFPSSSQDNAADRAQKIYSAEVDKNDDAQVDDHDLEMKLKLESSNDDLPSNKLPHTVQEDDERRTSTSSAITAVSLQSLDGAGPGDLDLSRSSERSTDKRSSADDLTTSLLDDLVQKGRLYSCQYCNIYFPELSMYVFHKGCHGPDAPFQCNFCYETFNKFDFMAHFLFCVHSNRK